MPHSDVEADAPIAAAGEARKGALSLASQDLQLVPIAAIASHRGTLRRLDLQRNRLDDPAQLSCSDSKVGGNLQALTHLNISRNNLKQLPVEIGQLQCLVELIALSNNIKPTGLPVEQATTPTLHIISVATLLSAPASCYLLLHSSPLQPFVLRCHTRTALRTAACTRLPRSVVCLGTNTHHSSTFVSVEHCGAVSTVVRCRCRWALRRQHQLNRRVYRRLPNRSGQLGDATLRQQDVPPALSFSSSCSD